MPTSNEPWTIGRLLSWTVDYLGRHGAENPRLDAEVLLAHARGCGRIDLYTAFGDEAARGNSHRVSRTGAPPCRGFARRLPRRPSRVLFARFRSESRCAHTAAGNGVASCRIARPREKAGGWRRCCARVFHRCARSPDPALRPTEGLPDVDLGSPSVPEVVRSGDRPQHFAIADVGTGSGILAICAAKYLPNAHVTAIDISPDALAVARRNAARHSVADRISFIEGNLLSAEPAEPRFDYIVSNPPYVSTAEMEQLARDVREHEPHVALRAGEQGTDLVAPLIEQAAPRLKPGGVLLIEVSPMIAAEVEQLVRQQPSLELGPTIRDLAGHARVVQASRRAES